MFLIFALIGWLSTQTQVLNALGLTTFDNASVLIALSLWLPVFSLFTQPLFSFFSRKDEFEADQFSVKVTNGQDLQQALLNLHLENAANLNPHPLYWRFFASHPPLIERLRAIAK